jgi:hypothetical protein
VSSKIYVKEVALTFDNAPNASSQVIIFANACKGQSSEEMISSLNSPRVKS